MNYIEILVAGIGGGIGGGLGTLLGRKFENKTAKTVATLVPILLFAQIAPSIYRNSKIKDMISPPSKFELVMRKSGEEFKDHPILNKAIYGMNAGEAHAFTMQKTKQGLKRLSFEELKTWNSIRIEMAKVNPIMCAIFWTGKGITSEVIEKTLSSLNETDALNFIRISLKAAILEIEQAPYEIPPADTIQTALKNIAAGLNKEDGERFGAVLISGVNATNEDGCWAIMLMLKGSESMKDPDREQFLRAMASL